MKETTLESVKNVADTAAGVGAVGALLSILPELAAAASFLWMLIRIGEWGYSKIKARKAKK